MLIELDDGTGPEGVVLAQVSSQLVAAFLGLSPADYQAIMEGLDGPAAKRTKKDLMDRFMHFHGIFWVEKVDLTDDGRGSNKKKKVAKPEILLVGYADDARSILQLCGEMSSK